MIHTCKNWQFSPRGLIYGVYGVCLTGFRTSHTYTNKHTNIHTNIHTYKHTNMHTNIQTYVQTYIRTDVHTYIHTYRYTYKHANIQTCIHTYVHTYIHTYIQTHKHTYKRTNIQTYIHTYIQELAVQRPHTVSLWGFANDFRTCPDDSLISLMGHANKKLRKFALEIFIRRHYDRHGLHDLRIHADGEDWAAIGVSTYIHTYIHTHIHTYIHTYIHT